MLALSSGDGGTHIREYTVK